MYGYDALTGVISEAPVTSTPDRGSPSPTGDPGPDFRLFLDVERDASELRAAARAARDALAHSGVRYRRLSDLLDEWLPADRAAQDRIARAVSMPAGELDALRRSRVDPLTVSLYALFCLADAFGIPVAQLRALVSADHERFAGARASARGVPDGDGWAAFDAAHARVTAENPARFSDEAP